MTLGHSGEAVLQPLPQLVMGETSGYTSEDEVSPSPTSVSFPPLGMGAAGSTRAARPGAPEPGPWQPGYGSPEQPQTPQDGNPHCWVEPVFPAFITAAPPMLPPACWCSEQEWAEDREGREAQCHDGTAKEVGCGGAADLS